MKTIQTLSPEPFRHFCMTIGELPTSYMESMTYYEMLAWFCEYLKGTVIPAINENAQATTELQGLYTQLKEYVDNYFENLDVQDEINNKLDAMAEDGTLGDIINQEIFDELNDKVEALETKVNKSERNSKWNMYIFCDNEYRQSVEYIRELLTRGANAGFAEAQMTIHIEDDGTLTEDMTKFSDYNAIADELGIPITSVKYHGKWNAPNYERNILDTLQYFPHVEVVFAVNEQAEDVYAHCLQLPPVIKNNYPNVKKVGFTIAYNNAFFQCGITETQINSIMNVYDILGVHMYPSCSSFTDSANCSYTKVKEAFNAFQLIPSWKKEIWITESGVLPFWQMMELPENYLQSKLTDTNMTTEPQKLFYRALNECDMAQQAVKIIPWYTESGMSDSNHEMFDILRKIILGR